jgi:hypothetical protein
MTKQFGPKVKCLINLTTLRLLKVLVLNSVFNLSNLSFII